MLNPDDIRRKAERLYRPALAAWLDGDEEFFPKVIRGSKTLPNDIPAAAAAVERLRDGSKAAIGYGYTIEWREVASRHYGRNSFPERITFETRDDLLRFIGKQREFARFRNAVERLRREFPELLSWIRRDAKTLRLTIEAAPDLDGILATLRYFREHPRPGRFARELPLPVGTKFIEEHQRLLREWLDLVLPPHAIWPHEEHFERRYGLRYKEPHLFVRFLDAEVRRELGFPCDELSLPLETLGRLPVQGTSVYIVENGVNLLTLPPQCRGLGLGALGDAVPLLRYLPWLAEAPLVYWGDVDVEGFEILSALRMLFPHTRSLLMSAEVLDRLPKLVRQGTGRRPPTPPHLTADELAAFHRCRDDNQRIEQERIPQSEVEVALAALSRMPERGAIIARSGR